MLRRFIAFMLFFSFFVSSPCFAQETVRVIILPFSVHAERDLTYLENEIPRVIRQQLESDGAMFAEPDDLSRFDRKLSDESVGDIRNLGAEQGVDYVVRGSLTWIGEQFSLDSQLIRTLGDEPPAAFNFAGKGIENLPGTVKKLADDLAVRIFSRERIAKVLVEGNKRIEVDAIKRMIKTKAGDTYRQKQLSEDLKAVFSLGYFDDVRIEADSTPDGKVITFTVKEKPTVRAVTIKGNDRIYSPDEVKEVLSLKAGSILNLAKVQNDIRRIEDLYREKNYHNVKVEYTIHEQKRNKVDIEFAIDEGSKVRIDTIEFEGNQSYSDKELKKVMKTSERSFFSWLTSAGELNMDDLNEDVARLEAFYQNSGYIQARVGEPQVNYQEEVINITVKIDEGPRFKVGTVEITGDLIVPEADLIKKMKIAEQEFYSRQALRNDLLVLTDLYSDEGYAYADINPRIEKDFDKQVVNLTCVIDKGKQVYFEEIIITGNTKTRDKVIRRELKVYEQELYSGARLKRGVRNLHRLDYFEDIKVNTERGSADDKMVLSIDVAEKPTGMFSFGGGYSSEESAFAMVQISQRNLFGRGQILNLKGQVGGTSSRYTLSFTEPWLFDRPLSAGFDLYNWEYDYDTYDKHSIGGALRFGYPVYDYTRGYISYALDMADITDVQIDAPDSVRKLSGITVTSSIATKLRYDSRDHAFNASRGGDHSLTVEYAGLGGDVAFVKYTGELGQYVPLFWGTVGFAHAKAGYIDSTSGGILPDYERFYLGGINSIRGFDREDLSPKETNEEGLESEVGGIKFVQFNLEYIFPLIKDAGLNGVFFFDAGDVYDDGENIDFGDLASSYGGGIRWNSPMGPLRVEYGQVLTDAGNNVSGGKWEFSMGSAF